ASHLGADEAHASFENDVFLVPARPNDDRRAARCHVHGVGDGRTLSRTVLRHDDLRGASRANVLGHVENLFHGVVELIDVGLTIVEADWKSATRYRLEAAQI